MENKLKVYKSLENKANVDVCYTIMGYIAKLEAYLS